MLPDVTERLLEDWSRYFPGTRRPRHVHYLGVSGFVEAGTATFLGFDEEQHAPLFVAKVLRQSADPERLLREQSTLSYVQTCDGIPVGSVPRVLLCEKLGHAWVLVQTVLGGRTMIPPSARRGGPAVGKMRHHLRLATEWIAHLHAATRVIGDAASSRTAGPSATLAEFARIFEPSPAERDFLAAIATQLPAIGKLGTCVQHGDYTHGNILIDRSCGGEKINVIDWTESSREGLVLHDLIFFLVTYFLHYKTGSTTDQAVTIWREMSLRGGAYQADASRCLQEYGSFLGIDPGLLTTLIGLSLAEQAVFDYTKLVRQTHDSTLPLYTVHVGVKQDMSYESVIKEQVWRRFLQEFAGSLHRGDLALSR